MEIVKLSMDDLKPYSRNAKKHPKKQIEQIKNSITAFGMNDPIGIWGKENLIVEGHGRYEALKQLGYKEVECIRLDHLTDEERKAYTLAHNKLTMNSDFDFDLLEEELDEIFTFDMQDFGFEFIDHEQNKEDARKRVANILNLEIAQFEGVGKYDIPEIYPVFDIPEVKEWIRFDEISKDKNPEGKGVHFFCDDFRFMRIWNNPTAYVEKLKQYEVVVAPDFSPYGDMPHATQIFNHYRKHWVAAYLQSNGVNVIPCIRRSTDERSKEWYLDGEPKGGIVCISSMWTEKEEQRKIFLDEYNMMIEKLKPKKVFVYWKAVDGLKGNIEYIPKWSFKKNG